MPSPTLPDRNAISPSCDVITLHDAGDGPKQGGVAQRSPRSQGPIRLPRCPDAISRRKRSFDCERDRDCRHGETCCSYGFGTYCASFKDYDYGDHGVRCGWHTCRHSEKCVHAETEGCFEHGKCVAREICVSRGESPSPFHPFTPSRFLPFGPHLCSLKEYH